MFVYQRLMDFPEERFDYRNFDDNKFFQKYSQTYIIHTFASFTRDR